ncbi:hypothetical protein V5F40_09095 [Xanthobacter sp. DSM 14520]|uniref:hypothetical protein n=1 Tax=Xanthobacter autotrophicus (strain ATCC BAA-1158 / Py2) TaxID=78245 RepID=UPI003727DA2B
MHAIVECEMPVDRAMPAPAGLVHEQLFWSESISPPNGVAAGVTANVAPSEAEDGVPGARPHFVVHVFNPTGLYVAVGTAPDATNPSARRWLRGGTTHRIVAPNGSRLAWAA